MTGDKQDLTRVAVITGGAAGLGQAYAERLAKAGFDIAVADQTAADETRRRVEVLGRDFMDGLCDVASEADVTAFAAAVADRFGRADVLVNNAGIYPGKPFLEMTFDDWRRVMSINLDGSFLFARAFAPRMVERGWGRIINIASSESWMTVPDNSHYIASKMGVVGLTRGLATELGAHKITVNAVAPGVTRTPGATADPRTAGLFDEIAKMQSIHRTGETTDLVGLVAFLASEEAGFISGQTIICDGGLVRL